MIAQVALPFAVALAIATPAPSPAESATNESPAPVTSPTSAPVLGGVTIDENANAALRMFGLHQGTWPCLVTQGLTLCVVNTHYEDVGVALTLDTKVRDIIVQGSRDSKSHFADPLGIKLGDPVDRLATLRGKPDASRDDGDDLVVRYGPQNGINWQYKIHDTTIVQIELSDGT